MSSTTAQLRHRELTQEIYNIGDEVAEYIEHIMEAVSDWDLELVEDCLAEFDEIITEARDDSRTGGWPDLILTEGTFGLYFGWVLVKQRRMLSFWMQL